MQLDPAPASLAPPGARILDAMIVVVVADLDTSIRFYQRFLGSGTLAGAPTRWRQSDGAERLRALAPSSIGACCWPCQDRRRNCS
ncbi:MAG TPA: VOC family protein [Steroidobacteraceae bacterium]|nr:VOC family protein [Steroidobacteraceae bacterium]